MHEPFSERAIARWPSAVAYADGLLDDIVVDTLASHVVGGPREDADYFRGAARRLRASCARALEESLFVPHIFPRPARAFADDRSYPADCGSRFD